MQILHVSTLDWGGAANACLRLHQGLLKQNVSSRLLVMRKQKSQIPESYQFYESTYSSEWMRKGVDIAERVHNKFNQMKLLGREKNFQPFNFSVQYCDITASPLYKEADIINFHWVSRFLDYKSFFKKNNKPVVWTLHDMEPFTGGFHYEKGFLFSEYDDLIRKQTRLKKQAVSGQNISIVGPSRWLMERSRDSEVFGQFPHYNIPYGLDTKVFNPVLPADAKEKLGIPQDKKAILFVSEVITNKRKGFHLLMDAIRQLTRDDIAICAVGKVDEDHDLHEIPNFYHLGVIRDERKMSLAYSAADVFVIPSIEDNLPNTVLESICSGTPVIGYPIGGVPDMVIHEKNGLICDAVNADSLAVQMNRFLDNIEMFDREWIAEDAHERYNEDLQAQRYQELYRSILEPVRL